MSAGVGGSVFGASAAWLKRGAWAAGGLAVFGGAAGLAVALGDNNDDDPVTSPVTP